MECCPGSRRQVKKREAVSLALNLSWTMLFSLLIPLLAGIWLDKKLGTTPLFILVGAVLGILAATVCLIRLSGLSFVLPLLLLKAWSTGNREGAKYALIGFLVLLHS